MPQVLPERGGSRLEPSVAIREDPADHQEDREQHVRGFDCVPQHPLIQPIPSAHDEVCGTERQSREDQRAVSRTRHGGMVMRNVRQTLYATARIRRNRRNQSQPIEKVAEFAPLTVIKKSQPIEDVTEFAPAVAVKMSRNATIPKSGIPIRTKRSLRNFLRPLRSNEPTRRYAGHEEEESHRKRGTDRLERLDDEEVRGGEWCRKTHGPQLSHRNVRHAGVHEDDDYNKKYLNIIKVV